MDLTHHYAKLKRDDVRALVVSLTGMKHSEVSKINVVGLREILKKHYEKESDKKAEEKNHLQLNKKDTALFSDYTKLKRDELRDLVVRLTKMKRPEVNKLKVDELKEILKLHYEKENVEKEKKEDHLQLRNLYSGDTTVFSEYRELDGVLIDTSYTGNSKCIENFINKRKNDILNHIKEMEMKIYFMFEIELIKSTDGEGEAEKHVAYLTTCNKKLALGDDRKEMIEILKDDLQNRLEQLAIKGSGFRLNRLVTLRMFQTKMTPLTGAKYMELPDWIKNKKAVINIKNNDNFCFMWCVLAHLFPVIEDPERVSKYSEHTSKLNFKNFEFPFKTQDLDKFEKRNKLAINIVAVDEKGVTVESYKVSKNIKVEIERVINLLLITNESGEGHFCLIKNIDRLMRTKNSDGNSKFCIRCHNSFYNQLKFDRHLGDCMSNKPIEVMKPCKSFTTFSGIKKTQKHRFVCYSDFESVIYKIGYSSDSPNKSWSENIGKHVASGFCVIVVDSFNKTIYDIKSFVGYDTIFEFNKYILDVCTKLLDLPSVKMVNLTREEWKDYHSCKNCPECELAFDGSQDGKKVRDHDHWTGEYRGVLCNSCNLLKRKNNFIPVFFHNLKGYDSHHIISDVKSTKMLEDENIEIQCISPNMEKFISFSYHFSKKIESNGESYNKHYEVRFLDSLGFMPSSLDCLSGNLKDEDCIISKKYYNNDNIFSLLRKKGVYPYDFMDSFGKYENIELPSLEAFHNSLTGEDITIEKYEYAQKVWKETGCINLKDYTEIYMINDVLLLTDVFETFRNVSLEVYKLDPCWYYTSPGLAFDAMLKMTKVQLQTIKDIEMYNLIEKGIRGGMCNAMLRHSQANNRHLKNYNKKEESKYLLYLDANNLYGWAMSEKLPYEDFKFEYNFNEENYVRFLHNLENVGKGCILEVDLDYPKELHDKHNDLPFCPENKLVGTTNKLISDLSCKTKYVIHYKSLLQALDHGLVLKKVHRVVSFSESKWLAPYIELNTNLRKNARNNFEKDFFKLMNNSVFGKTMENVRNRVDIRICTDLKQVQKLAKSNNFKRRHIINDNMILVEMVQKNIVLDKPIYVGMSILDLSKTLMYEFHYDVMVPKYTHNLRLCYQDTDSYIYEIKTHDVYQDMMSMKEHFDTSDYPSDHELFSVENKKVIGKFKDEMNGKIMSEVVALQPKQYAFKIQDISESKSIEVKKNKGIKRNVVKNEITFEDYKKCLMNNTIVRKQQVTIHSSNHQLHTIKQNKVAFNNVVERGKEAKRYIVDNINTLAFGHFKIPLN